MAATKQNQRTTTVVVRVAVRHRRAVHDGGVVEQRRIAIHRRLELVEQVRQQTDVVAVDLGELPHAGRVVAMVRRRMETRRHAAVRIHAGRGIAAHLERKDARHVTLQREHLQVEHDLHMIGVGIRHTRRRTGQFALLTRRVARFDLLNAPLDFADVLEVLVHTTPVAGAELTIQLRHASGDPIEHTARAARAIGALGRRATRAEQLLERDARITDHRQRFGRRAPADRVGVHARVAIRTAAGAIERLNAQLHGRNRGHLAKALRVHLIERCAREDVRAFGLRRMRLREKHRARPEMVTADLFRLVRFRHAHVGVAHDREILAPRFQRRQRRPA